MSGCTNIATILFFCEQAKPRSANPRTRWACSIHYSVYNRPLLENIIYFVQILGAVFVKEMISFIYPPLRKEL
jgi:hypothetical protein